MVDCRGRAQGLFGFRHLILLHILCLASCADTYQNFGKHKWDTPAPLFLRGIPQGDDSYSLGFRDGCNTMMGVIGSGMLRMHEFSQDINRSIEDKDYYLGYRLGQNYCTYYIDNDPL